MLAGHLALILAAALAPAQENSGIGSSGQTSADHGGRAPAAESLNLTTGSGFSAFATMYYLHPQPERVADAISALEASGLAAKPPEPRYSPFVNWFAEVFVANPDRLEEWRKVIDQQNGAAKELLEAALIVAAKGGMLHVAPLPPSPGSNDWYWSGFFASGNPAYIRKLIDQLHYIDNRQDLITYAAGGSAEWSLSSNARQHPRVREIVQEARSSEDAPTVQIINDLLKRDPGIIRGEVAETMRAIQESSQKH